MRICVLTTLALAACAAEQRPVQVTVTEPDDLAIGLDERAPHQEANASWMRDCGYPKTWEGPAPGAVAEFEIATETEIQRTYEHWNDSGIAPTGVTTRGLDVEGVRAESVVELGVALGTPFQPLEAVKSEDAQVSPVYRIPENVLRRLSSWSNSHERLAREWIAVMERRDAEAPVLAPKMEEGLRISLGVESGSKPAKVEYDVRLYTALACSLQKLAADALRTKENVYFHTFVD